MTDEQSGIESPRIIDLIGRDPATGAYVLYMFETRTWEPSPERLQQLSEKVNAYVYYVTTGQMVEDYPESKGHPLRFELRCLHAPDPQTLGFIALIQQRLSAKGIKLIVHQSEILQPGN